MKNILRAADVREMLLTLGQDIEQAQEELTLLDSAIGDGDLGMTLCIGFREVKKVLGTCGELSITDTLVKSADAFAEKAASTFGTLLTAMMTKAGRAATDCDYIDTILAGKMLRASVEIVQKRGKAQLGDKTLLDALIPAAEAVELAGDQGKSLFEAAKEAVAAATEGAESTVNMKARTGRSGYLGERTIGQKDPGAAAVTIILKSFLDFIST